MKAPLSYLPLALILPAFILGIILANFPIPLFYAIFPAISAGICFYKKQHFIAICMLLISLGWIDAIIHKPQPLNISLTKKEYTYTATVLSDNESETMQHILVEIKSIYDNDNSISTRTFKCNLTIPSAHPDFEPGDIIQFKCLLKDINNCSVLPNQQDINRYLKQQGATTTAFVEVKNISIIKQEDGLLWNIRRLRPFITHLILKSPLNENTAIFLNAIITGDTSYLSEDTRINYSGSGLAHILALSGMHVAIITMIISISLFPLYLLRRNKYRHLITIFLLWIYAIFTGLSPSVTRSVIMATVYLFSLILQRRHSSINTLCFAAILILLFDPQSLFSISFQLSFVAVASILLFAEKINPFGRRFHPFIYYITSLASVSIAATIGTGLIAIYYFHIFPTYFLLGNIIVSMLLPFLMCAGIIYVLLQAFDISSIILCRFTDFIYCSIDTIASYITSLPYSTIQNIYISPWLFIPIFASIISFAFLLYLKRKVYLISTILLVIFTISIHYISKPTYNEIEYFIPREAEHTSLIIREQNNVYISTTADSVSYPKLLKSYKLIFRDYLATREIDSLTIIPTHYSNKNIQRHQNYILADNDIIYIADQNNLHYNDNIDIKYLLVCQGFSSDIIELYNMIKPDTILLSNDLHIKRHNSYADTCEANDINYISLRNTHFYKLTK